MKNDSRKNFDLTKLVSPEEISILRELGKHDWVTYKWSINGQKGRESICNVHLDLLHKHGLIGKYLSLKSNQYFRLFAMSKAIAGGLKIIAPTTDQCEAMAQVEARLPFKSFKQPFPSVVIAWPNAWRPLGEHFDVTWLQEMNNATAIVTNNRKICASCVIAHDDNQTIEDVVREKSNIVDAAKLYERVAINLCLLMTIRRWTETPIKRPSVKKAKKMIRSKKRRVREDGQQILDSIPQQTLLSFDQEVRFFHCSGEGSSNGNGISKKPHWRKGHFRLQAYGPGRSKHRLIFIPPVLVNRGQFGGDEADTTVTYRM